MTLQNLDKEFMECLEDYKNKKEKLFTCQEENKKAKASYEQILEKTSKMFDTILDEDYETAKEFVESENKDRKKDLNNILTENGINERNPFDPDVILNSVNTSIDIYKKEIEIYVNAYDRTRKLLDELQENDVKLDKHKKFVNDSNCKIHFLSAEKDYVVGFLDNERIAAIYDIKTHRKLMLEACRNFEADLIHISSLYDILLKEAASRASKRLYKDNYNKSYLTNIEKTSESVNEENNKLKANSVAVMNLNYWRIEGISRIQEAFEKDVQEIYGRDLEEIFPKEVIEDKPQEISNQEPEVKEELVQNIETEKEELASQEKLEKDIEAELDELDNNNNEFIKNPNYKLLKSSKESLAKVINNSEKRKIEEKQETENNNEDGNSDYGSLFEKISMLDDLDDENFAIKAEPEEKIEENKTQENVDEFEEINDDNSSEVVENIENNESDDEEESIFDFYFKQPDLSERKRRMHDEKKLNGDKKNFFKKIIGFNSKKQKEA